MTSPNANATPTTVSNKIDGIDDITGQAEPFRLVAMLYDAHMFGLSKDYAFPENPNVSASFADIVTTLGKLLTRTHKMADGNDYTMWDAIMTGCKAVIAANPHINDDEPLSVNYKSTT